MRFWQGFVTALVLVEAMAMLGIGWVIAPPMVGMIGDLGGEGVVPPSFELVTSPAWPLAWGLGLPALAFALVRRASEPKRSLLGLVLVALVGLAVVGFTLVSIYGPLYATAGRIE